MKLSCCYCKTDVAQLSLPWLRYCCCQSSGETSSSRLVCRSGECLNSLERSDLEFRLHWCQRTGSLLACCEISSSRNWWALSWIRLGRASRICMPSGTSCQAWSWLLGFCQGQTFRWAQWPDTCPWAPIPTWSDLTDSRTFWCWRCPPGTHWRRRSLCRLAYPDHHGWRDCSQWKKSWWISSGAGAWRWTLAEDSCCRKQSSSYWWLYWVGTCHLFGRPSIAQESRAADEIGLLVDNCLQAWCFAEVAPELQAARFGHSSWGYMSLGGFQFWHHSQSECNWSQEDQLEPALLEYFAIRLAYGCHWWFQSPNNGPWSRRLCCI